MFDFYGLKPSVKSRVYAPTILNNEGGFAECTECGSVYEKQKLKDVSLKIEGKSNGRLPDILLCGHWPLLIVSQRVAHEWREFPTVDADFFEARLYSGESLLPDKFFHVRINSKASLDFKRMNVAIRKVCKACGKVEFSKPTWEFGEPKIVEKTYHGEALFVLDHFEYSPICSKQILELVYKKKFTNFSFDPFISLFKIGGEEINLKTLFGKRNK
ncbi:MAG: hypothetical protein F9K24_03425 [Leptonema illini]|jgi:hypothetical protein|uniref:Uncharacterized protein n=1 Tax=Leptonema illini TaxID=183 RepID=A0A833LYP2_9LEPT|nr:MAG: hypothetical protein F9K24_03425 [Leptonema illini]